MRRTGGRRRQDERDVRSEQTYAAVIAHSTGGSAATRRALEHSRELIREGRERLDRSSDRLDRQVEQEDRVESSAARQQAEVDREVGGQR